MIYPFLFQIAGLILFMQKVCNSAHLPVEKL